jgi:hypothetical protein
MERAMGIEPMSKAWEAFVLPLNYARVVDLLHHTLIQAVVEVDRIDR